MITQLVAGDRQLLEESLCACARAGPLPTLWTARRLAGKLCFVWLRRSGKFWFFNLLGREDRVQVGADVRVRFALEPTWERSSGEVKDLPVEYVPPRFVLQPPQPGSLRLQLPEGRTLEVRFSGAGNDLRLVDVWPDGRAPAAKPKDEPVLALIRNQSEFLRLLVEMFAAWRQTGDEPQGLGYPLDLGSESPPPDGANASLPFRTLVREIKSQVIEVLRQCQADPALEATSALDATGLGAIHPLLGGGYTLTQIEARALLQLDTRGELFREPKDPDHKKNQKNKAASKPEWHQVDVLIRVRLDQSPRTVRIGYLVPDILTPGTEYHERFVEKLDQGDEKTSADLLYQIAQATLPAVKPGNVMDRKLLLRATLAANGGWANAVFLRIASEETQKDGEGLSRDEDLVLLPVQMDGTRSHLVFLMEFRVTAYPEVRLEGVDRVRFLGRLTRGDWAKPTTGWAQGTASMGEVAAYFHRQFSTLGQWQQLQQPASTS